MEAERARAQTAPPETTTLDTHTAQDNSQQPPTATSDSPWQNEKQSVPGASPETDDSPYDQNHAHYPSPFSRSKKRSPDWHNSHVEWKHKWSEKSWQNGRVLVVDYIRHEHLKNGLAKIAAQEFNDEGALRKFYASRERCNQAALRIIHVQNASWARRFLLYKFNIMPKDDLVGTDFGRWLKFERPEWRGGRPLLKGKTWRIQRDPWRKIERTAFGVDYIQPYDVRGEDRLAEPENIEPRQPDRKLAEMNCYDDNDAPTYGYDLFVQRLSVYIQHKDPDAIPPEGMRNPYSTRSMATEDKGKGMPNGQAGMMRHQLPPIENLDNGNTIIVFENSHSELQNDTLIQARNQIESRWRQLTFYLDREDVDDDQTMAQAAMNVILEDVFKAIALNWDTFLNITETHINILEDKIYESPADETRAPELWSNSSLWLKVEKLAAIHTDVAREMVNHLREFTDDSDSEHKWLEGVPDDFDKINNLVQEDLVKPTATLNDLMYKSVEIRDSRQSLQLNNSLWRLSWITFIFLPLTFIGTVFGMNVDTFSNDPSIKWYFIAAVVLMILVLISWYGLKHALNAQQQTPYQRGVYEHLFHDLAVSRPQIWSRGGPRDYIRPVGFYSRIRWRLLTTWFDPAKTIRARPSDPDEDAGGSGLGMWARTKRTLARRWLNTIKVEAIDPASALESGLARPSGVESGEEGAGAATELLTYATPAAAAEAEPSTHPATQVTVDNVTRLMPQFAGQSGRQSSDDSRRPSSSGEASAMMVEERDVPPRDPESAGLWRQWPALRRQSETDLRLFGTGYG